MHLRPVRGHNMREINEKLVLRLIHTRGAVSQSEVVTLTGLAAPTVFRIFSTLLERGYIEEADEQPEVSDRRGRRPSFYRIKASAAFTMGIDLSTREASVLVTDFAGDPVSETTVDLSRCDGVDSMISELIAACQAILAQNGIAPGTLLGVGLGAPGVVDIAEGRVVACPRFPALEGYALRERLEEGIGVPVSLHNNASIIALAEYRYGGAIRESSVVAFLLRAGVGGAFIQDGKAFVSRGKTAFEAGRWLVHLESQAATQDGARLEDYLSEDAILAHARERAGVETWQAFLEALGRGETRVTAAVQHLAQVLARAMENVAQLLEPEVFLVITRSQALSDALVREAAQLWARAPLEMGAYTPRVVALPYDPIRACRGAADLVFDSFFSVDEVEVLAP